jgi:diguanylate cyclase (GGDEF)-like protein/PAS domain S-box-containing protein
MSDNVAFSATEFIRAVQGYPQRNHLSQTVVDRAKKLVDADFVQLCLPNRDGGVTVWAVAGNQTTETRDNRLPALFPEVDWCAQPTLHPNPASDPVLAAEGIVSALLLPIQEEFEGPGLLLVGSRRLRSFTPADIHGLTQLVEQAVPVLVYARALTRERRAQAQTAALLRAAERLNAAAEPEDVLLQIVDVARELLDVVRCTIVTYNGTEARIRHSWHNGVWELSGAAVSLETSLAGWTIRHQQTHRAYEANANHPFIWHTITPPKAVLSVPLFNRDGRIRGNIGFLDRKDEQPFSETHQQLAEGIAQFAALALERADLTAELRRREEWYRRLFEDANDLIFTRDLDGRITNVNHACESLTGYSRAELLGMNVQELLIPEHRPRLLEHNAFLLARGQLGPGDVNLIAKDGRVIPVEFSLRLIAEDGRPVAVQGIGRDISDRKALEEHLTRQAFYDPLTGLANRALFMDRLRHALRAAARHHSSVTVLFLDLDDFKEVNDCFGHRAGDELLATISQRLAACLRPGDTLARLGGDEFTVLLSEQSQPGDALVVAERLRRGLTEAGRPFQLRGQGRSVGVSIGIASSDPDGRLTEPNALLQAADIALYRAKNAGKGRAVLFEDSTDVLS